MSIMAKQTSLMTTSTMAVLAIPQLTSTVVLAIKTFPAAAQVMEKTFSTLKNLSVAVNKLSMNKAG